MRSKNVIPVSVVSLNSLENDESAIMFSYSTINDATINASNAKHDAA